MSGGALSCLGEAVTGPGVAQACLCDPGRRGGVSMEPAL